MTPSLLSNPFFESLTQKKLNFEVIHSWSSFMTISASEVVSFYLAENREKVKLDYKG
jgi:hypothetical protein